MNLEYLRHGKALCGKVFRRFVETFNFHNDFVSNLKGDADLPVVGGKLHLDRTDERHPVIRCQGCGKGGGDDTGSPVPWSFFCAETEDPENPGEKKRTGGWDNCRLQVGLDCNFYSSWKFDEAENRIKGTKLTDDGHYYLRVNLSDGATPVAEIVIDEALDGDKPRIDYERGIVSIFIGSVSGGKLDERTAMHMNPTVWKYL